MTGSTEVDGQVARLRDLAVVLLPGGKDRPAPTAIDDFDGLLARAIAASGQSPATIAAACAAIPESLDWDGARRLAEAYPDQFGVASRLACAAYYMSREALDALGFPQSRENPAEVSDFVEEMETGVFDPVIASKPRFRDDRR